jgi:mRNA (2'-O-methyladenosine-N6-)-methyltransferase
LADPPWQLATHAPTRGVAIAYQQLPDVCIEEIPIPKLSKNGFIFIWVINNKYAKAFELMEKWGYKYASLLKLQVLLFPLLKPHRNLPHLDTWMT